MLYKCYVVVHLLAFIAQGLHLTQWNAVQIANAGKKAKENEGGCNIAPTQL